MPEIGEIKRGHEIGYTNNRKHIWAPCESCGKLRWVSISPKGKLRHKNCYECSLFDPVKAAKSGLTQYGNKSIRWRGGRILNKRGYVRVWISRDDFFFPMADKAGYIPEHRLVMAKKLGRCLQPWEIVHHKGIRYSGVANKSDNLEDNLELVASLGEHSIEHSKGYKAGYQKGLTDGMNKQIQKLKLEIKMLREECHE